MTDLDDSTQGSTDDPILTMFEFERIRCKNLKTDNKNFNPEPYKNYEVPSKRSGHRAICDDENLWIWGGYCPVSNNEDNPMLPELFRFNFATKRWCLLKTTGDAPDKSVASHCGIKSKNFLIVIGGTGFPFGQFLNNNLYTCNLKTLVWTKHDLSGQVPMPLYGSSLVLIDNYLYLLFGTTSRQYCSNVYKINIQTLESANLFDSIELVENATYIENIHLQTEYPDDFLAGRYRQEVAVYESKLYAFGGGKFDGDCFGLEKLPCFNTITEKWEFVETWPDLESKEYPESRKFHSCFTIDDFIYVFGGIHTGDYNRRPSIVSNFVWRLNMRNMRWQRLDIKLPVMTYFHGACEINGQVFIQGGVKQTDYDYKTTRINHLYTIHLKIPKLSELAWKCMLKKYPNLIKCDHSKLSDIGLPVNFINKIN